MTLARRQVLARTLALPLVFAGAQTHAQNAADAKPLIVYLSRTGNTQAVARMVQARTGGVLHALETLRPYPADYRQTVDLVSQQNQSGDRPGAWPAVRPVPNLNQHQHIFIGFPVWGMQLPPPIKAFLRDADLRGKTLVPFSTYATVGEGRGFDEIATVCARQGCTVAPGLSLQGGRERDGVLLAITGERAQAVEAAVQRWLQGLGFV